MLEIVALEPIKNLIFVSAVASFAHHKFHNKN